MIFTDTNRNIKIELLNTTSCKITIIDEDLKQIELIRRLLNAYTREAPLDGGIPAQFRHEVNIQGKHILIDGNMINAISALCDLDLIEDHLRDDIIEQVALDTLRQSIAAMHIERGGTLIDK